MIYQEFVAFHLQMVHPIVYKNVLIHLAADGRLGFFQFLAILHRITLL